MRDAEKGTYNGNTTFCPVNAYGNCPYRDQSGVCHIDDPMKDCSIWSYLWDSWEDWQNVDWITSDDDINDSVDETGYNPYEGAYDYDC